ncbi:hypothetical protein [Bdellovibrio sp. NC01]|uniref:hypothetical protein n=1 Tax=Bdellovibrio sp. NC01 TaxID=2220073 RepID=UPI00115BE348|nr:hypothetical protein [Bdellovibrio sp. NC01]QDK36201.1 hypothetical protein DOE51_00585 [Bdellovibrio sp. NC01]
MLRTVRNQRGQFVIEGVLLMIVMVSIFIASMKTLREGKYLANMIERPWAEVSGMLECGSWGSPATACKNHPNQSQRSVSLKP